MYTEHSENSGQASTVKSDLAVHEYTACGDLLPEWNGNCCLASPVCASQMMVV